MELHDEALTINCDIRMRMILDLSHAQRIAFDREVAVVIQSITRFLRVRSYLSRALDMVLRRRERKRGVVLAQ